MYKKLIHSTRIRHNFTVISPRGANRKRFKLKLLLLITIITDEDKLVVKISG